MAVVTQTLTRIIQQPGKLTPAVGTVVQGRGRVVLRDVNVFGLHRMCVSLIGTYPDLETWSDLLEGKEIKLHHYSERMVANVCECFLWLFWKEG